MRPARHLLGGWALALAIVGGCVAVAGVVGLMVGPG